MAFYQLRYEQKIPTSLPTLWDFISSPKNLATITPDYLQFQITSPHLPEKMYAGMLISYSVQPLFGIKMTWVTEISQVKNLEYFVDEQRIGPYAMWHHQHFLEEIEGGVLMQDTISYSPPLGMLGALANALFIEKQLHGIFEYRKQVLNQLFGKFD